MTDLLKEASIYDIVDVFKKEPDQWIVSAQLLKQVKDSGRTELLRENKSIEDKLEKFKMKNEYEEAEKASQLLAKTCPAYCHNPL